MRNYLSFPERSANFFRTSAGSFSAETVFRLRDDRRDFAVELAAQITRKRRAVLVFDDDDAHEWLLEFVRRRGHIRQVQILPTSSLANLPDWAEQWRPGLVVLN